MEQPVRTVLFVLAQKSIIVIILKALNISTLFCFFCHFILTFSQLYLFRLLTQRFFNSKRSATLQWWQFCCISRLVSVLSGEGRDQHMTTNFNCSRLFSFCLVLLTHFSTLGLLSISPKNTSTFFSQSTSPLLSEQNLYLCRLYRGIKLSAIPVTDSALIRYSPALSPPPHPFYSLILNLPLAFSECTGLIFFSWQSGTVFAQGFSDFCCTLLEKNKQTKKDA